MPMEPTLPDPSIFFHPVHHDDTGGQFYDDLDDFSNLRPLPAPTAGTSGTDSSTHAAQEERQPNAGSIHDYVLGCDHRLSSLNLDLSRRLQQYLAIARSQENPMLDMNPDSPPATDSGKICQEGELFRDALSDTSEFLAIIQSYGSERRGGSSDTIHNASPRLGIIVTLNLLSVYLQLAMIYDKLFQCLSNQLFDASVASVAGPETLPVLQLTGFSVQRGNLQTKILIHAILHQFEMIESILGLPTEFRVTEKQDSYSGLFEDGRAGALLEAMSNGKWCHAAVDDHCGLKALSSLREMLKRVQMSLNM